MATTPDMAPERTAPARARSSNGGSRRARPASSEQQLEAQISRLQDDVRAIAASLAKVGGEKVQDVQRTAKQEYKQIVKQGQNVLEDVGDEFEAVEKQLKDTIRARPLTAVLSAIGLGFLLAVLTR